MLRVGDFATWICALSMSLFFVFISVANLQRPSAEATLAFVQNHYDARASRNTLSLNTGGADGGVEQSEWLLKKPKYAATEYKWKAAATQGEDTEKEEELSHGILAKPMLSARRNHDCMVKKNEVTGHMNLWLVGGRYAQNVETVDLVTGEQQYRSKQEEDLLNSNHFNIVHVKSLKNKFSEIWIPCGFEGAEVNQEWSMKNMKVIELGYNDTVVSIKEGPQLDRPRGACAAIAFDVDGPQNPKHICVFGGSDGKHDKGVFLRTISCYDRQKEVFTHPFGELPAAGDHHNLIHVPPGSCDNSLPEMLLYLNFRAKAYADESTEIHALNLTRDATGKLIPGGEWYLFANDKKAKPRDASGFILGPSGRYLFNFGGTHYMTVGPRKRRKGRATNEIRSLDLCTRKWINKVGTLDSKRFALMTCSSKEFSYTCGGDMTRQYGAMKDSERTDRKHGDMHNGRECEVHRLADLEKEATRLSQLAR